MRLAAIVRRALHSEALDRVYGESYGRSALVRFCLHNPAFDTDEFRDYVRQHQRFGPDVPAGAVPIEEILRLARRFRRVRHAAVVNHA